AGGGGLVDGNGDGAGRRIGLLPVVDRPRLEVHRRPVYVSPKMPRISGDLGKHMRLRATWLTRGRAALRRCVRSTLFDGRRLELRGEIEGGRRWRSHGSQVREQRRSVATRRPSLKPR